LSLAFNEGIYEEYGFDKKIEELKKINPGMLKNFLNLIILL